MTKKIESNEIQEATPSKKAVSRRDVIKGVTIGGTAFAVTKWSKPVMDAVILPAHAATSPGAFMTTGSNAANHAASVNLNP